MKLEIVNWFEPLCEYLWKHKKELLKNEEINGYIDFNYPNYAGLPKEISNNLYGEHVDLIQENLFFMLVQSKAKRTFFKKMADLLTRDIVRVK